MCPDQYHHHRFGVMITFSVTKDSASSTILKTYRCEYDDLHEHIKTLFQIAPEDETFVYVVPNDYSGHVRLCSRLLNSMFDNAEKSQSSFHVNLKVYQSLSFMKKEAIGGGQQIPVTVIPKSQSSHRGGRYNQKHGKCSNVSSLTNSTFNQPPAQSFGHNTTQSYSMSQPSHQLLPVQKPVQTVPVKSKHAAAIEDFFKLYQISSPGCQFNATIEGNPNAASPVEHKSQDNYSLSLVLKSTGTENLGKDFVLAKIAGNGSPPSFSLPLLKPQVQRTISISIDFSGDEESSYWAIKQSSTGIWIGSILALTILKAQKKVFIRPVDYAEAEKLMEGLRWK